MEILGVLAYYVAMAVIFVLLTAGIYRIGARSRWWMILTCLLAVIATTVISPFSGYLRGTPHETQDARLFQLGFCICVWSLAAWLGSKWIPEAPRSRRIE